MIWSNPNSPAGTPTVVYLTQDTLSLVVAPVFDFERVVADLQGERGVGDQKLPLAAITQVQGEEAKTKLRIAFKQGEKKRGSAALTFADHAGRDEFLEALRIRLGSRWKLVRERRIEGSSTSGGPLL